MENADTINGAAVESGEGGNPLAGLVPDSIKETPAFVVAGAVGWFIYQHRGTLGAFWGRIRGRGRRG